MRAIPGRLLRPSALLWSPAAICVAFLIVFLAKFPSLIDRVYWDSDAASAARLAQSVGHGTIAFDRFAYYTFLLFAVVTRSLPYHRQIWEVGPYCFALVSVALLARISWRLAGWWAAAMTATVGVATSPFVSYDRVTLNYHTPTFFATVVLAAFCYWLTVERRTWQAGATALLAAVLAGISLTDGLFAFVGLFPLVVAGLLLALVAPSRRVRLQGLLAVAAACLALPFAWLTVRIAVAEHLVVAPKVPLEFASAGALWPNVGTLLHGVVQLANGNSFFGQPLDARSILSLACAASMLAALTAPFVLLRRERRSTTPRAPVVVAAGFWAACIIGTGAGFVLSSQAETGLDYYYFTPILYAVAATVPLAFSTTVARRSLAALGVGLVALTSVVNLLGSAEAFGGRSPIATAVARITTIARQEGATTGFASYWDASDLTWATHAALQVAPVETIGGSVFSYPAGNVSSSWFTPRRARSFLLEDPSAGWVTGGAPQSLGPPLATFAVSPGITMWVYPYDISTRFAYPADAWSPNPSVTTGSGFNGSEEYEGMDAHWMIQDGRLLVSSDGFTAVALQATAFANGRPRALRVLEGTKVVARLDVPIGATVIHLGPFLLPAGRSVLTLESDPGPTILGPNDPRDASVFLAGLEIEKECVTLVPASGRLERC